MVAKMQQSILPKDRYTQAPRAFQQLIQSYICTYHRHYLQILLGVFEVAMKRSVFLVGSVWFAVRPLQWSRYFSDGMQFEVVLLWSLWGGDPCCIFH